MIVSGDGKHKLVYRMSDKRFELYDLAADPRETGSSQPSMASPVTKTPQ